MENRNRELGHLIRDLGSAIQRFVDIVTPHLEPVAHGLLAIFENIELRDVMRESGWLPHYTTPLDLIANSGGDADAVRNILSEYYQRNWDDVRKAIESGLDECNVDEEAKATLREALEAHEHGLYRSVCRLLFPEMERLLRVEIFGLRTGRQSYKAIVKKLVDGKTLDDFPLGGWYDFDYLAHLTKSIREHDVSKIDDRIFGIFTPVEETDLQRLEHDPVPNRHAAMHGYVSYASEQNSLNTIFVADYIFRLISNIRNTPTENDK